MTVLVAYASRHGATKDIAERITEKLAATSLNLREDDGDIDLAPFDAVVIGSAAYMFHWLPEATEFVRRHAEELAKKPVWLFSSGPLGTDEVDDKGRDVRAAAEAKEIPEFRDTVMPRDHRVFFGALDTHHLGLRDGLIRTTPAGRKLLPEGDFRDWDEVDAYAAQIAEALRPALAGRA
jgi:menaquinone-dependent protoporphyrinogen oxidase